MKEGQKRRRRVKRLRRMAAGVMASTVALTGGVSAFAQTPATDGNQILRTAATTTPATYTGTSYVPKYRWYRGGYRTTPTTPTPTTPTPTTPTPTTPAPTTPTAAKGEQIVNIAMGLKGRVSYGHTYDAANLVMDCSGFTYYVFKQAGIDLKTRDDDVQATMGTYVPRDQLQKGDLVFFWNSSSTSHSDVGHVGIYIGNGQYIHNAGTDLDVVISNVDTGWAGEHYITARRITQ